MLWYLHWTHLAMRSLMQGPVLIKTTGDFIPQQNTQELLTLLNLANKVNFIYISFKVSSVFIIIGYYHLVIVNNQEQWQQPVEVWLPPEPPWLVTHRELTNALHWDFIAYVCHLRATYYSLIAHVCPAMQTTPGVCVCACVSVCMYVWICVYIICL